MSARRLWKRLWTDIPLSSPATAAVLVSSLPSQRFTRILRERDGGPASIEGALGSLEGARGSVEDALTGGGVPSFARIL
jgi:hypothetical protein